MKKAISSKTPKKDFAQKVQVEYLGKGKSELTTKQRKSFRIKGTQDERSEDIYGRNKKKLKELEEISVRTEKSSLSQGI